ncbi:hypothetical protein [Cellulomonas wangsupingiae]|uniref:Type IV toxin-antitoxin system AbiEi family antitoxin domain-containing protein n=1 Tax=Cellulomonas wangsupingiae TaxID=2968085 RepID=A0ABY5KBP8_9CELL|nr:hypothetical protein [Cellulomonas wangsupingiae]MCC2334641.1 hypothetical protein [Cellulomonas wangsupingiae]UUI66396.1 hypothetical protein NP075_06700 [Cellulomonas wangsupingiae]
MDGERGGGQPGGGPRVTGDGGGVKPGGEAGASVVHVHAAARGVLAAPALMQRRAASGQVVRVRRGTYVGADEWQGLDERAREVVRVRAVHAAAARAPVFSHWSAAAVLGLPVIGRRDAGVHVVRAPAGGGRSHGDVVRHAARGDVAVAVRDGITVTSAARTVVDLARVGGVVAGVVAGDAAVRHGWASLDELRREVERGGTGRGVRAARAAVDLVDGRSESPGESLSRVRMAQWGLPAPVLQHEVRARHGFVGWVDFWWPELGVAGEFDGRVKYGTDAADVLWEEKLREDRLRASGLGVARWTWSDAWAGDPMVARLRTAGVR